MGDEHGVVVSGDHDEVLGLDELLDLGHIESDLFPVELDALLEVSHEADVVVVLGGEDIELLLEVDGVSHDGDGCVGGPVGLDPGLDDRNELLVGEVDVVVLQFAHRVE